MVRALAHGEEPGGLRDCGDHAVVPDELAPGDGPPGDPRGDDVPGDDGLAGGAGEIAADDEPDAAGLHYASGARAALGDGSVPGGRWPAVVVAALLAAWVAAAGVSMTAARTQLAAPPAASAPSPPEQFSSARPASAQSAPGAASGQAAAARPASAAGSPAAGSSEAPPRGDRALAGAGRRPVAAATPPPGSAPPASPAARPGFPGASPPAAALPPGAGWWTYADPAGFTIRLPDGWAAGPRTATHITFTGPRPGFAVVVWWTTSPQPDQLTDWRQQAAYRAQTDPTYRQLAIARVSYRGYNSANWEFSSGDQGQSIHVLDHGFIVTPGALAYAIELYGPQAGWAAARAGIWAGLLDSFTPAG